MKIKYGRSKKDHSHIENAVQPYHRGDHGNGCSYGPDDDELYGSRFHPFLYPGKMISVYTPSFARACRNAITPSRPTIPTNCPFSTTGSWFKFASAIC